MNARSASMGHWSISMPIISPALRLGRKLRPDCCSFKSKRAKNSPPTPEKPPKRLRVPLMPTPRRCFMRCGTWPAMIRVSAPCWATNPLTINSRWQIPIREDATALAAGAPALRWVSPDKGVRRCRASASLVGLRNSGGDMVEPSSEDRDNFLSVPWVDTARFIRQLSHDLRNHLNAIELQSAYIGEFEGNKELKVEIKRLREMISRLTSTVQKLSGGMGEI